MDEDKEIITINTKKTLSKRISAFFANPKKRLWFIIISGLVLIAAVATGLYFMNRPEEVATNSKPETKKSSEPVQKYYGLLDGVETDQPSSTKHPLGIMVENHIDARPQAGLDKASIVYEAIAEGGITRFLALYGTHEADKVGPVRSARTYYVDWAEGYNAYLSHVGGNYDALEKIIAENVLDLDQFKYPSSYWRDTAARVSSEHTMFASTIKLREQAAKLGYTTANNFKIYRFKPVPSEAATETKTPTKETASPAAPVLATANKVNVNFSSANYNIAFQYDAATGSYKRLVGGKVQLDRENKSEIAPKNLIVMTVKRSPTVTKINESGWNMDTIGEGAAKIFIGGQEIDGRWAKTSRTEREIFYDSNNQEITFDRGQFWICVIPPDSTVTFE